MENFQVGTSDPIEDSHEQQILEEDSSHAVIQLGQELPTQSW